MPDIKGELETVKRLTGIYDESRIEINEVGWTSRAYIIDGGKIVFKFPRNERFRDECKREAAALELLKEQKFCVNVPILNWTAKDNSYFGFYGVLGTPLREVIDSLSDEQKTEIGKIIGQFLRQLHGTKVYSDKTPQRNLNYVGGGETHDSMPHTTPEYDSNVIKAQTLEEQALEYRNWYSKGRESLASLFRESELLEIDEFFAHDVPACMVGTGELVFCHGDLDYNNTLIHNETEVGVIDFGDAGLYDRSQDFRGMDDEILLESMMKAYGDDKVISKSASAATSKMIDVLNLIYCIENNLTNGVDSIESCSKRVRLKLLKDDCSALS